MRWPYFISLVALLGAGLLLFFNILCGSTTATPINKWYWLEAGTESIPGAHPVTRWTSYNSCGVSNGHNVDCTDSSPAYPMSPASNFDTTEGVPEGLQSRKGTTYYLSKTGWAFLLIGLLFTLLALIPNLFSVCLPSMRLLTGTLEVFTILALLFIALSASLLTAGYVKARNSFRDAGHSTSLGRTMLAFIWSSVFLLAVASLVNIFGIFTRNKMTDREKKYTDNYDITSSNHTYGNDYSGEKPKKKTFGFLRGGNHGQEVDDVGYTGSEPVDQLHNTRTVGGDAPPYSSGQLRGTESSANTNLATGTVVAGDSAAGLAHHQQSQTGAIEGQHSGTGSSSTAKAPPGDLYNSGATTAQKLVDSAMDTSAVIGGTQRGVHTTSSRSQYSNLDEPELEEFKRSQACEATDAFEATATTGVTGIAGSTGAYGTGRGTAYDTSYNTADISKDKNITYVGTGENLEDWRQSKTTGDPSPSTSGGQYETTGVHGGQGLNQQKTVGVKQTFDSRSSPDQSKENNLDDEANRAKLQKAHDLGVNAGAYAAGKKAGLQHVKQQYQQTSLGGSDGNDHSQEVGIPAHSTGATVTQGQHTQSSQTPKNSSHSKTGINEHLDEVYEQSYKEGAYAAGIKAGQEAKRDKFSSSDASKSVSGTHSKDKTDEKLQKVYDEHYKAGAYVSGLKSGHQEALNAGDESHVPVEKSYSAPGKGASGGAGTGAGAGVGGAFLATGKESDQRKGRTSDTQAYEPSEQARDNTKANQGSGGQTLAYHGGDEQHITAGESDATFTDAFGSKKRDVSGGENSSEKKGSGKGILATAAGMLGLGAAAATSSSTEGEDQEVNYTGKPDAGPGATLSGANAEKVKKAKAYNSSHHESKSTTLPVQQQGSRHVAQTGVPDNSAKSAAQAATTSSMGHYVEPAEGPASRADDTYNSAHIGSKSRGNDFTTTSGYAPTEYYERKTGHGVDSSDVDPQTWNSGDRITETDAFTSSTGRDASSYTVDPSSWKHTKDTTKSADEFDDNHDTHRSHQHSGAKHGHTEDSQRDVAGPGTGGAVDAAVAAGYKSRGGVDESHSTSKPSTITTKEARDKDSGTGGMAAVKGKSGGDTSTASSSDISGKGHGKSKSTDYDRVGEQSGVDKSYRTAPDTSAIKPVVDLTRNRNPIAEGIASANLDKPADIHASHAAYESNTAQKLRGDDVKPSNTPRAPVGLHSQPNREDDSYSSSSRGGDLMSKSQAIGDSASSTYDSEGGDFQEVTSTPRYTTDTKAHANRATLDPRSEPRAVEEANREAAEAQHETSFVKQVINSAKNVI